MSNGDLLQIEPQELQFPCNTTLSWCQFFFFFFFLGIFFLGLVWKFWKNRPFTGFCLSLVLRSAILFFLLDVFFELILLWSFLFFSFREVELRKQISCSMQLINKSDNYVAFKVFFFFALHIHENSSMLLNCAQFSAFPFISFPFPQESCFGQVKTTNPKKYCVRPNTGIVLPHSTCDVIGLFLSLPACVLWDSCQFEIKITSSFELFHANKI